MVTITSEHTVKTGRKWIWFFLTFFSVLSLTILYHLFTPFTYANNDDFFIHMISSGMFTGQPEAYLLHIGFFPGVLLYYLYSAIPNVPWYGLFFCFCMIFSVSVFLYTLEIQCRRKTTSLIVLLCGSLLYILLFLQHLVSMQYTTITILTVAISLAVFYLQPDEEKPLLYLKSNIFSLILFFLAINIRTKACLLLLPFFCLIGIAKVLRNKSMLKSMLTYATCILLMIILTFTIQKITDINTGNTIFKSYNSNRETIYDINGYPDYEKNRELYQSLGISYQSYENASMHYQILLDENINENSMRTLAGVTGNGPLVDIFKWIKTFIKRQIFPEDQPLNVIVTVLYCMILLYFLLTRKFIVLYDYSAILCTKLILWIFILYLDRPVFRITQGVFMAELLLLLGILFFYRHYEATKNHKTSNIAVVYVIVVLILGLSLVFGVKKLNLLRIDGMQKIQNSIAYHDMQNYFYTHADILYLCDVASFMEYSEEYLSTESPSAGNMLFLGGWSANSPWSDEVLHNRGITHLEADCINADDIRFVFMNAPETCNNYLVSAD